MTRVRWRALETGGVEVCTVDDGRDGVRVEGRIDDAGATLTYVLQAEADWSFRDLVARTAAGELHVGRDAGGSWTVDGVPRPDLAEAREVDLSASPLTNTLPVRRLRLAVGASADIVTAYVAVTELTVTLDPQRYTRVSEMRYRYDSLDSDFTRVVEVDADGLVVDYPGLFVRV